MADLCTLFWICLFTSLFYFDKCVRRKSICDGGKARFVREGNIGESGLFPWLGVLRVHIHRNKIVKSDYMVMSNITDRGGQFKIAASGIVLIKENFALGNADDVARIPMSLFTQDSKAMFLLNNGTPWFCELKNYLTHPDYNEDTVNTVAIIELQLQNFEKMPITPICWPQLMYNASDQLYIVGYTDENRILEKTIFKLQYVRQSLCEEFYQKSGLNERKAKPIRFHCGFGERMEKSCTWDAGMVMASNSSGNWTIIGLSVSGPGCSAPSRYIDVFPYLPWVESATEFDFLEDF